jgi:hypothetical protein
MLETRKLPRRKMVLPVKVTIDKVTHLAHTVDITHTGAPAWRRPNAIATRSDRHFAARLKQNNVPDRMGSTAFSE